MGVLRGLAAGTVFVAAAVGLAYNAAAEAPLGRYTATVIDDSPGGTPQETTTTLFFHSCGQGCAHVLAPGGDFDLHLTGSAWTGTANALDEEACTHSVDAHLIWTHACTGPEVHAQLTKSG